MTDANDPRAPHRIGAGGARRVAFAFARAVVQTGHGEPASGTVVRRSVCEDCGLSSHLGVRALLVEPADGRVAVQREVTGGG